MAQPRSYEYAAGGSPLLNFSEFEKALSDIRKANGIDECYERKRQLEFEVEELRTENVDLGNQFRYFFDLKNEVISEYKRLEIMYSRKKYSLKQFNALVQRKVREECRVKIDEGVEEHWERYSPAMVELAALNMIITYPHASTPSVTKALDSLRGVKTHRYVPATKDP